MILLIEYLGLMYGCEEVKNKNLFLCNGDMVCTSFQEESQEGNSNFHSPVSEIGSFRNIY